MSRWKTFLEVAGIDTEQAKKDFNKVNVIYTIFVAILSTVITLSIAYRWVDIFTKAQDNLFISVVFGLYIASYITTAKIEYKRAGHEATTNVVILTLIGFMAGMMLGAVIWALYH